MGFLTGFKVPTLDGSVIVTEANGVSGGDGVKANGAKAAEGDAIIGIAMHDAALGERVTLLVIGVCTLIGSAAITPGADIQVDAASKYKTKGAGVKIGKALTDPTGDGKEFSAYINCI